MANGKKPGAEWKFGRGSYLRTEIMEWRMCYPIEPNCKNYKEPGLRLHFSASDAQHVKAAYAALLEAVGLTTGLRAVLGPFYDVLAMVIADAASNEDGTIDVRSSAHAFQINDDMAKDPLFWSVISAEPWRVFVAALSDWAAKHWKTRQSLEDGGPPDATDSRGELLDVEPLEVAA